MSNARTLPAALPVRGSNFGAAVVATTRPWRETLPRFVDVDGEREDLYDEGDATVRGRDPAWRIGDNDALTLRRAGRLWVLQHIATLARGSVVVLYAPRDCPRALALLQRLPQRARWLVVVAADGTHTIPSLQSDSGAVALAVKAAWPATWRRRRAQDDAGDPLNGIPASLPTGAVILGSVLV